MSLKIVARQHFQVGHALIVDADSPAGRYAVVFEDDGVTGAFHAVDTEVEDGNSVQDALLVYVVADVLDVDKSSLLEIGWSDDGAKALLLIDDAPYAAFDFQRRRGWCLCGLPDRAIAGNWSAAGHAWTDDVDVLFE